MPPVSQPEGDTYEIHGNRRPLKMCKVAVLDEEGTPLDEIRFRNDMERAS
jgi:hypothetical protein